MSDVSIVIDRLNPQVRPAIQELIACYKSDDTLGPDEAGRIHAQMLREHAGDVLLMLYP